MVKNLTEAEEIKKRWQEYTEKLYKKDLNDPDKWRRQWHPTPVPLPGKSHGRRAWQTAVHGVAQSRTRLGDFTFTFHFHALEKEMATHSSVLAWRIPGMREPGGLPSMGSDMTEATQQQQQHLIQFTVNFRGQNLTTKNLAVRAAIVLLVAC